MVNSHRQVRSVWNRNDVGTEEARTMTQFVEVKPKRPKTIEKNATKQEQRKRNRQRSDEVQFKKLLLQTASLWTIRKHLHCSIDQVNERATYACRDMLASIPSSTMLMSRVLLSQRVLPAHKWYMYTFTQRCSKHDQRWSNNITPLDACTHQRKSNSNSHF